MRKTCLLFVCGACFAGAASAGSRISGLKIETLGNLESLYELRVLSPELQSRLIEVIADKPDAIAGLKEQDQETASLESKENPLGALLDYPDEIQALVRDTEQIIGDQGGAKLSPGTIRALNARINLSVRALNEGTRRAPAGDDGLAGSAVSAVRGGFSNLKRNAAPLKRNDGPVRPGGMATIKEVVWANKYRDARKAGQVAAAAANGTLDDAIFNDPHAGDFALEAYRDGRLSLDQLGTLRLFHQAREVVRMGKAADIEVVPMFVGSNVNPRAYELFNEKHLPTKHWARFVSLMRSYPVSEQRFLLLKKRGYEYGLKISKKYERGYWAVGHPFQDFGFPMINDGMTVNGGALTQVVVPSFGLMQSWLDKDGRSLRIRPEFGFASRQELREAHALGVRPIALEAPGRPLPDTADSFVVDPLMSSLHDFYHAIKGSESSHQAHAFWDHILDVAKKYFKAQMKSPIQWQKKEYSVSGEQFDEWDEYTADGLAGPMSGNNKTKGREESLVEQIAKSQTLPLIVRDLAVNPEFYRNLGYDPKQLIARLDGLEFSPAWKKAKSEYGRFRKAPK